MFSFEPWNVSMRVVLVTLVKVGRAGTRYGDVHVRTRKLRHTQLLACLPLNRYSPVTLCLAAGMQGRLLQAHTFGDANPILALSIGWVGMDGGGGRRQDRKDYISPRWQEQVCCEVEAMASMPQSTKKTCSVANQVVIQSKRRRAVSKKLGPHTDKTCRGSFTSTPTVDHRVASVNYTIVKWLGILWHTSDSRERTLTHHAHGGLDPIRADPRGQTRLSEK